MDTFDYFDIETGEGIPNHELLERYDAALDEISGEVAVGTLSWSASYVLREVDPIAYHVGFNDWLDSELGETLTETPPDDDDDNA